MLRKVLVSFIALCMVATTLVGCNSGKTTSGTSGKPGGTITVWSFLTIEEMNNYATMYNKVSPNVKVNSVVLPSDAYMTKVQAVLRAGTGAPDVLLIAINDLGQLKDTSYLENLSPLVKSSGISLSDIVPYVADLSKDSQGNLKGLSWQACPGGFWFKKDLATQYLGTDDPDAVSKLVASWDDINTLSKSVSEKSGGKIHLFDSYSSVEQVLLQDRTTPYVDKNNKLMDKQFFVNVMNQVKTVRENDGDAKLDQWTAPWSAAFYTKPSFILLGEPSWGLHYCIKANTPADAVNTTNSWGFAQAPTPYEAGGTWMSIYANSKNKTAAWDYVKTCCLTKAYLQQYVDKTGDMISFIPEIKDLISNNFRDPFTGDQPIYQAEYDAALKIKAIPMTKYDNTVVGSFVSKEKLMLAGQMTPEQAVDAFEKDLKTQFPELVIG